MATPVVACPPVILQFFNNSGQPNAGGSVLTQVGGVNYATYQDSGGATPLPNPIPLNSRGEVSNASGVSSQLFLASGVTYTFTVNDSGGNQLYQATYVGGVNTIGPINITASAGVTAIQANPGANTGAMGLGLAASAWGTNWNNSIDFGAGLSAWGTTASGGIVSNAYYNGTNWIYKATAGVSFIGLGQTTGYLGYAPSGTAGTAATISQALTWNLTGNLTANTPSAGATFTASAGAAGASAIVCNGGAQTPPVVVTWGATITLDASRSNVFTSTANANSTTLTITSPSDGQTVNWFITQDATGSRTITWGIGIKWPGGTAGVLSTAANAVDLVVMTYRASTGFWYASLAKAFS